MNAKAFIRFNKIYGFIRVHNVNIILFTTGLDIYKSEKWYYICYFS